MEKNGFVVVSQRINFHSFSFQIAVHLTLFVIVFNKVFKNGISCLVLLLAIIISGVFQLILVKLFKIVYILIRQDAPLGFSCRD